MQQFLLFRFHHAGYGDTGPGADDIRNFLFRDVLTQQTFLGCVFTLVLIFIFGSDLLLVSRFNLSFELTLLLVQFEKRFIVGFLNRHA